MQDPAPILLNPHVDCYRIPQDAPRSASPADYPATLDEIESLTDLKFFPSWGRETPIGLSAEQVDGERGLSRIREALAKQSAAEAISVAAVQVPDDEEFDSIEAMIVALEAEAAGLQVLGRPLTDAELAHIGQVQHAISWLIKARDLMNPPPPDQEPPNLVTYKIVSDQDDKLKVGARTACNFWNRYIEPGWPVVIRLAVYTSAGTTIARAYKPYTKDGTVYGVVEFNTKYLDSFTDSEIAGTLVHELGHTLGIGFEKWQDLFHRETGKFKVKATRKLPDLGLMEVELDHGPGTELAHWDEQRFQEELMTGIKDPSGEYVLPVTVDVMGLLGHTINVRLDNPAPLEQLLDEAASIVFSRQDAVQEIDRDHFEQTDIFETIPHQPIER